MTDLAGADGFTTVQSLIWPEPGICTERDLYVRLNPAAGLSVQEGQVHFAAGGTASFSAWFNLFNLGRWQRCCDLSSLFLALEGEGRFELVVFLSLPHHSWERVVNEVVTLSPDDVLRLDLTHVIDREAPSALLYFELKALEPGRFYRAGWQTRDRARRDPELMLAITTFRREEAVRRTAARFERFAAKSPIGDRLRLVVVDNGQSAEIPESPHVRAVLNENLGGAGGFARGLLAARDSGATHCLFMDDDASVHMASLERTWIFLAYATDPRTAVAGAMINAGHRWAIWENGACFDTRCIPLHMGTDLRELTEVTLMEHASAAPAPWNFYGGWWYFAFPVEGARHMPFPFFVRGDDVSFSLANDFAPVVLNGVVSFQDSFTDKESPLTWYLDLRSHMAHHLSLPHMERGRWKVLKIAVWFYFRNLPRMQYDSMAAIALAVEDVMRGPAFFDANADMAERRGRIRELTRAEAWEPVPGGMAPERSRINPQSAWQRLVMKLVLNGHLVPFFTRLGNVVTIDAKDRGSLRKAWGARQITYLSANGRQCYTVRHSKARALKESLRLGWAGLRFLFSYNRLRDDWRGAYDGMTSQDYWRNKLKMEGQDAE